MYQSVEDDGLEGEFGKPVETNPHRIKIAFVIVLGLALLALAALMSATGPDHGPGDLLDKAAARADYLAAIEAPTPALRRARLTDLMSTYPKHEQILAARAQLQVLDEKEAADWAEATNIFYDPESDVVQKIIALDQYERVWGANLTGGREAELSAMRIEIDNVISGAPVEDTKPEETEVPDFTPDDKSVFSNSISGDTMAGGSDSRPRGTYIPPSRVDRRPFSRSQSRIEEPRVRRNVTPRYPSKALRRNVEAVVTLSLYIDDDGDVEMTELVSVSAPRYRRDFIRAAERAALRTRFYPKRIDGRPVPASGVMKRYIFQLDD